MPFHRTIMVGAGLCLAGLAGWASRSVPVSCLSPNDEATLAAALGSSDVAVRRRAAELLINRSWDANESTLRRLVAVLGDEDLVVRGSAAAALVSGGQPAVGHVIPALQSENPRVRRCAVGVLTRIEPPPVAAVDALTSALSDRDPQVRRGAGAALARLGSSGLSALRAAVRNPKPCVRCEAIAALALLGPDWDQVSSDDLAELLLDPDDDTGETAADALAGLGATGLKALARALDSECALARSRAATILERIGPAASAALPALLDRSDDREPTVRQRVAQALGRIGDCQPTICALRRLLVDTAPAVRCAAAEGLGHVGRPALPAVADLLQAQTDADMRVRTAATRALLSLIQANDASDDLRLEVPFD